MTGTIINIVLNPIFIFTLGLGAAGSALATVTSNVIGDLLMIYYLRTKSQKLTTSIKETKVSWDLKRQIYAIGIPVSITNVMATLAMALTNRYLIDYGADSVAAMGIALKEIGAVDRVGRGGRKVREPLFPDISSYWSRHTWATIAASMDIPKETISAALGHEIGSAVTSIYIDFDQRKVDEANRKVIDALASKE